MFFSALEFEVGISVTVDMAAMVVIRRRVRNSSSAVRVGRSGSPGSAVF